MIQLRIVLVLITILFLRVSHARDNFSQEVLQKSLRLLPKSETDLYNEPYNKTSPENKITQVPNQGNKISSHKSTSRNLAPAIRLGVAFTFLGFLGVLLLCCCRWKNLKSRTELQIRSRIITRLNRQLDLESQDSVLDELPGSQDDVEKNPSIFKIETKLMKIEMNVKKMCIDHTTIPKDRICVVCMDNIATVQLEPCKHDSFCATCSYIVVNKNRNCPLCRTEIDGVSESSIKI